MGLNLQTCCHKCKVKVFHFRRKENLTLMPFYNDHYNCMKENPSNIETKEDQTQEENWMNDYKDIN